jgi:hypothetical protein
LDDVSFEIPSEPAARSRIVSTLRLNSAIWSVLETPAALTSSDIVHVLGNGDHLGAARPSVREFTITETKCKEVQMPDLPRPEPPKQLEKMSLQYKVVGYLPTAKYETDAPTPRLGLPLEDSKVTISGAGSSDVHSISTPHKKKHKNKKDKKKSGSQSRSSTATPTSLKRKRHGATPNADRRKSKKRNKA